MKPSSLAVLSSILYIVNVIDAVTLGRKPHQHPNFFDSMAPLVLDVNSLFVPRHNPFFIYLNVANIAQKCENKQVCICYWGNTPDRPHIYEKDLNYLEKEQIYEMGYPEIRQAKRGFTFDSTPCATFDMNRFFTKSERESMLSAYQEAARKVGQKASMFADYFGNFERQAVCFTVSDKPSFNDRLDKLYHVEVQATRSSSSETFRFANEGSIPVQFNTKKPVMQTLSEVPIDIPAIFYLTPQICTFNSFNLKNIETNGKTKLVIEDKFIELVVKAETGCFGDGLLYYDPVELDNMVVLSPHPPTVESYFGTYLTKLNVSDPKQMKKRDLTSSLVPIFEEISNNIELNSIF